MTVVTDEAVVRIEVEKAKRGQEELFGSAIKTEQQQVVARKAARRDSYRAVERLVEQDAEAAAAAEVLRNYDAQERRPRFPDARTPRGRSWPPATELLEAAPGEEETWLVASDRYVPWVWGDVYESDFNDDNPTDRAFYMYSDDGEPDLPTAAVGFYVPVQTYEPIAFLNVTPFLYYQYKTRLTSSTSWLGDGEARGRNWFRLLVWQDGRPVTGYVDRPIWHDSVNGWSVSAEDDGMVTDLTMGFEMRPGLTYVVELGLWAQCDSSCYGACGGAFLDQWFRMLWVNASGTVVG